MTKREHITIAGAGLTGSLLGILLGKKGFEVTIYEKRSDMRTDSTMGGKSINLALSHRGLLALDKAGMKDKISEIIIPMRGRKIHDNDGNISFQPYGKDDKDVINSVSRSHLNIILLDELDKLSDVEVLFNHKITKYDNRKNALFISDNNDNLFTVSPEVLIAADGANSRVRTSFLRTGRFNYSQHFLDYGYKELEIPPTEDGNFCIDHDGLHIWPREQFMMIALPNPDKSFTATLFAPFEGEFGFDSLLTKDDILGYFKTFFPDIVDNIPNLVSDFKNNPTGKLVTIKCAPWNINGNTLLIGDAAHAIVPFYGQGMNAGFEDCRILIEMIEKELDQDGQGIDWNQLFNKFSTQRKPATDAIADLSYDNFIEMRDKVADTTFLEMKKAELILYEQYESITSKYAMVTFSPEMPYHLAKRKGEIIEKTLKEEFETIDSLDDFNPEKTKEKILAQYRSLENTIEHI